MMVESDGVTECASRGVSISVVAHSRIAGVFGAILRRKGPVLAAMHRYTGSGFVGFRVWIADVGFEWLPE
jgi:hypothetical protein